MRVITLGDTFTIDFTTRAFATGIPTALAGSPVLSVHEEANDTFITAGVSVDVSVGTSPVVGLNEATVVATTGNGYERGKGYSVFISTGTVDSVSVVGEVVGEFRVRTLAEENLEKSSGVMLQGTVDNTGFAPTTTQFESDDITEATADHFIGRVVLFTSGALLYQARRIDDYALATGRGHFTVAALTEAAANNDTFIIV